MLNSAIISFPSPLSGNLPDTWTHYSIMVRLPEILDRILSENDYSEEVKNNLCELKNEIHYGEIRFLKDGETDYDPWTQYISPFVGKRWLDVPWFFAELYFYRRVLEAVDYFNSKSCYSLQDPYAYQKSLGAEDGIKKLGMLLKTNNETSEPVKILEEMIKLNLWGNKADLSLWPTDKESESSVTLESLIDFENFLLVNQTEEIKKYFIENMINQVDFLIDNTGFELVCDLLFVDFLLENHFAGKVVFHLKQYPIFVSDALIKDVLLLIEELCSSANPLINGFGERLKSYHKNGIFLFEDEPFWVSPSLFWNMPADLKNKLSNSDLIISKGDANYRRINGDLHWNPDEKFENIYKPFTPLLILRVIKSDAIIGISRERFDKLNNEDPEWMKNGRWGLIQFIDWDKNHTSLF